MQFPTREQWITLIGLPAAGAFGLHLWNRYRGRMARLIWSAEHVPMAFATPDTGYGEVQVLYNGQPTINIHATRVRLQSESSRDLTDVVVHLAYRDGSRILRSVGFHPEGLTSLPHSDAFNQQLGRALVPQPNAADIDYVLRNHEYRIPVFNRGAAVQFGLLVTRDDHARPIVSLEVSHPGVRVDYREPGNDAFGVPRTHAQLAGVIVGLAFVGTLIALRAAGIWVAPASWIVGAFALVLGASVVRVGRFIGKLLS